MGDPRTITRLLHRCRSSDSSDDAFDALVPLVYDDLRIVAHQQLQRLRPGETLDTTALAHEGYLKLKRHTDLEWNDRRHFYAVAACAMRQILADYARRSLTAKRKGHEVPLNLEITPSDSDQRAAQLLYVDELLGKLVEIDEQLVRLVECRYFAGFTQDETAEVLGLSTRTVQRRWKVARALLRELSGEGDLTDPSEGR